LGLERITLSDQFFLTDKPLLTTNLIGCVYFEKFKYEEMKKYLYQKTRDIHKMRHKVSNRFGSLYWERLDEKEIENNWGKYCQRVDGVSSSKDLHELMVKEQMLKFKEGGLLYKFILIPDYSESKSCFIIKASHSMGDGMAFSSLFLALSDVYDSSALPCLRQTPIWLMAFLYLLYPFLVLKETINVLFLRSSDSNSIANGRELSKDRKASTIDLNLQDLKDLA
jgi:NRPS condensation-like uncharacterized protein